MTRFVLVVSNSDFPLVPPVVMDEDPRDASPMPLQRARHLAATMLDEYIAHNTFQGRNVRRARTEVASLEPQHFVLLGALRIELRTKGLVLQ